MAFSFLDPYEPKHVSHLKHLANARTEDDFCQGSQSATKSQLILPDFATVKLPLVPETCQRLCCEEGFMADRLTLSMMSHMIA